VRQRGRNTEAGDHERRSVEFAGSAVHRLAVARREIRIIGVAGHHRSIAGGAIDPLAPRADRCRLVVSPPTM
jgi:hypothetical protein